MMQVPVLPCMGAAAAPCCTLRESRGQPALHSGGPRQQPNQGAARAPHQTLAHSWQAACLAGRAGGSGLHALACQPPSLPACCSLSGPLPAAPACPAACFGASGQPSSARCLCEQLPAMVACCCSCLRCRPAPAQLIRVCTPHGYRLPNASAHAAPVAERGGAWLSGGYALAVRPARAPASSIITHNSLITLSRRNALASGQTRVHYPHPVAIAASALRTQLCACSSGALSRSAPRSSQTPWPRSAGRSSTRLQPCPASPSTSRRRRGRSRS
jgi:hypothetical protein